MKQRPILFSADMVRAILDGRKTQTRRIIKPQPVLYPNGWQYGKGYKNSCFGSASPATDILYPFECQYGNPGDHLWVRETWLFDPLPGFPDEGAYHYRATSKKATAESFAGLWRPSIHMPRAAARIILQITDIRAQRLHDITEADAIAEGLNFTVPNTSPNTYYDNYQTGRWLDPQMLNNPIASYRTLWEKINGPESWAANPWVWAITFKKK